ncbi:MAG: HD domain-containing protein [Bacteroidales bacterium]
MLPSTCFIPQIINALDFAARQHKFQRRKGFYRIPYINHPIRVMLILAKDGGEDNPVLLSAAALHDVVEDTACTPAELAAVFGEEVLHIVMEVTDDMSLPSAERKRKQVEKAPSLSPEGRMIKIADKIANMQDILNYPIEWSKQRKRAYFEWAAEVVNGCRGINPALDKVFDEVYEKGIQTLS